MFVSLFLLEKNCKICNLRDIHDFEVEVEVVQFSQNLSNRVKQDFEGKPQITLFFPFSTQFLPKFSWTRVCEQKGDFRSCSVVRREGICVGCIMKRVMKDVMLLLFGKNNPLLCP